MRVGDISNWAFVESGNTTTQRKQNMTLSSVASAFHCIYKGLENIRWCIASIWQSTIEREICVGNRAFTSARSDRLLNIVQPHHSRSSISNVSACRSLKFRQNWKWIPANSPWTYKQLSTYNVAEDQTGSHVLSVRCVCSRCCCQFRLPLIPLRWESVLHALSTSAVQGNFTIC